MLAFVSKRFKQNEKGFTLIEMMIVLLIISMILLVTVPNLSDQSDSINSKGCEALVNMVSGQVEAYELEKHEVPSTIDELVAAEYLKTNQNTCPNGDRVVVTNGVVSISSME
ncbi:competence protein ComG [Bacillus coahuilensis m2-6]|uniref:ComG operon protein 3 n=1 Tax=Bacillus coahuilensis p1.1.43 TaxID=1150625 RepID=A0A147K7B7_9BACI|nr:competence type IV pilus major pilin ComGC [Bacillus coahuilensis]KUP05963.1 competence protein ComG [Bacillus coahuilensis p1.1.43]KUP07396.1 competence protein ComG [Bacillus coahuilensis m2-6]